MESQTLRIKTNEIYYKKKIIGTTQMGLPIFKIKITASHRAGSSKKLRRKVIYVLARQHPGETPGSFVC